MSVTTDDSATSSDTITTEDSTQHDRSEAKHCSTDKKAGQSDGNGVYYW